jgi:exonuclease SbcC
MKILALRGRNLASLAAPFEIDFSTAPLKDAGVYAICGPTGAGKSTLLDALCLALYHRTPRLDDGSAASLADAGGEMVRAKDPRQWLRRGAAEGYAEVDFVGMDGLRWRARWSVKRARSKIDGRLQAAEASLLQIDSGERRGRTISEVREEIKACVGLDFAQFTRAVLLAQNQFARFLSADPNERAELLEALTGAQVYSRLSRAAFERARTSQHALAALQSSLQAQPTLSAEQRAALQTALDSSLTEETQLRAALQPIQDGLAWQAQRVQLQTAALTAQAQLQAAIQANDARADERAEHAAAELAQSARPLVERATQSAAQVEQRQAALALAQDALHTCLAQAEAIATALQQASVAEQLANSALSTARPTLKQARELDQRLSLAGAALSQTHAAQQAQQNQLDRLRSEMQQLQIQFMEHQARIQTQRDWCNAHAADQLLAEHAARLDLLMTRVLALRAERDSAHASRAALREEWRSSTRAADASTQALSAATQAVHSATQRHQAARDALAALDPAGLHLAQTQLADAQHALLRARQAQHDLHRSETRATQARAALEQVQQQLTQHSAAITQLNGRLPGLESTAQRVAILWHSGRDRADQHTTQLRSRLLPQQPCPVCGSAEHPYVHAPPTVDPALAALLLDLQQASETADAELHQAREALSNENVLQRQASVLAQTRQHEWQQAQQQWFDAKTQLGQVWTYTELSEALHTEPLLAALSQESSRIDQQVAALTKRQHCSAQQQQMLDQSQHEQTIARSTLERVGQQHTDLVNTHQAIETRGQWQASECERLDLSLSEAQVELRAHPGWPVELDVHAVDSASRALVKARCAQWTTQTAELNAATQAGERTQLSLEALRKRISSEHEPARQALAQSRQSAEDQVQQLREQRAALCAESDTEAWQQRLEMAVEHARQNIKSRRDSDAEARAAQVDAAQQLALAAQANSDAVDRRDQSRNALEQWLNQQRPHFPDINHARLLHWLAIDPAEIARRAADWHQLQVHVQRSQLSAEEAEQRLHSWMDKAVHYPEASELTQAQQTLQTKLAELLQRRGGLQEQLSADQRLRERHQHLLQDIEIATENQRVWAQLSELIGSADGAKFRRLAQQYTLDLVLAYANVHLRELAARYQLRRDGENLLVADRDLGEALRAVSSLSGGESFLVSLALALGLASLTAQRLRIESLFIDEGFGALDEHSLRQALDALDRLQAQGRKIGVISHLTELTERVGTRIEVRRIGHGASVVEVRG